MRARSGSFTALSVPAVCVAAAAALAGACVGDEPPGADAEVDAGAGGETASDASLDHPAEHVEVDAGRACDPDKPFGDLQPLPVNTPASEFGGRLSADGRMLVFARAESASAARPMNLFLAVRTTGDGPFDTIRELTELNVTGADEFDGTFTPDGLGIVFSTTRDGDGGIIHEELYESTRATLNAPFEAPHPIVVLNSPTFDFHPFLRADGTHIYFISARSNPRPGLFQATRQGGVFGAPTPVGGLRDSDDAPVVFARGLRILFRRDRDVYTARRVAETEPFGSITPVPELNTTTSVEGPSWVSEDGCQVIIFSNRDADAGPTAGIYDLYAARRPL